MAGRRGGKQNLRSPSFGEGFPLEGVSRSGADWLTIVTAPPSSEHNCGKRFPKSSKDKSLEGLAGGLLFTRIVQALFHFPGTVRLLLSRLIRAPSRFH